jgi:2-dehydropantoate 2-reductase
MVAAFKREAAGGTEFALRFLDEVLTIVRAVGKPPSDEFVAVAQAMLTAKGSNVTSSVPRSAAGTAHRGRSDHRRSAVASGKGGVAAPLLRTAFAHLSVYEHRLSSSK